VKKLTKSVRNEKPNSYDYLKVLAAIEFGMNEPENHLKEDIRRLCDDGANLEHCFIVHLYRLSKGGTWFSGRDWSSDSGQIVSRQKVRSLSINNQVEIFYGLAGVATGIHEKGLWYFKDGEEVQLE
jgi:hypothetical protein